MTPLCGLLAAAPLALADPPNPHAALDGHALGLAEGLLNYCTQADPQSAAALQSQRDALIRSAPKASVARVREADEYRRAYESITVFAGKVPAQNAKLLCTRAAPPNR
jgi:hypothetical protein